MHNAQELAWAGDGGAYLFLIENSAEYDEMVAGALRILDSLPFFNKVSFLNRLPVPLCLRISCHTGQANWDPYLHNLYSKALNYFLKSEREIGVEDHVVLTEDVFEQINNDRLRDLFMPLKDHDYLYRGIKYSRHVYVCIRLEDFIREIQAPRLTSYPSPLELADLLTSAQRVDVLLAGGDRFYSKLSEALELVAKKPEMQFPYINVLLRKSNECAKLNAKKYRRLAVDAGINIQVRWYDSDLMIRGYCFDGTKAFFSYFLREGDRLAGGKNRILSLLSGRSQTDDFLLEMFNRTFKAYFEREDSEDAESATLPFVEEF